ncbi:MAG: hypothetical protein AB7F22_32390 [Reyranella sp.]|uniref:hypothetical protein n=1 Tax=Reyranella sp. TaxID=1929291 RepID=UPI003D11D7D1
MRYTILTLALVALLATTGATTIAVPDACAQATCRSKCTDDEQACLKRTGNKSQCGGRAQDCLAKCK